MSELLDCGHPESPHSDSTRGYGTDVGGKRHCYDCCLRLDRELMTTTGKLTAYLSNDSKTIATWTGQPLLNVTRTWTTSAGGFAGRTKITRVQATDPITSERWYGSGPGPNMYIRMRRYRG